LYEPNSISNISVYEDEYGPYRTSTSTLPPVITYDNKPNYEIAKANQIMLKKQEKEIRDSVISYSS